MYLLASIISAFFCFFSYLAIHILSNMVYLHGQNFLYLFPLFFLIALFYSLFKHFTTNH